MSTVDPSDVKEAIQKIIDDREPFIAEIFMVANPGAPCVRLTNVIYEADNGDSKFMRCKDGCEISFPRDKFIFRFYKKPGSERAHYAPIPPTDPYIALMIREQKEREEFNRLSLWGKIKAVFAWI